MLLLLLLLLLLLDVVVLIVFIGGKSRPRALRRPQKFGNLWGGPRERRTEVVKDTPPLKPQMAKLRAKATKKGMPLGPPARRGCPPGGAVGPQQKRDTPQGCPPRIGGDAPHKKPKIGKLTRPRR